MNKTPRKKSELKFKNKYEVIELPSDNKDMETYVCSNRRQINFNIINNIDYALRNKLGGVEVFCFKNSSFVVVINKKDFKENLQGIFDFSLKSEDFEMCDKVKRVMNKMDKLTLMFNYKKIKK